MAIAFVTGILILMVSSLLLSNRANEETAAHERIDVRARPITVTLPPPYYGTVTGYHLFIVYIDGAGKQFLCEALPLDPNTGQIPSEPDLVSNSKGFFDSRVLPTSCPWNSRLRGKRAFCDSYHD